MISAIPTRYAGCEFRSRLEARWAVFFDAIGVKWEYEPEGYELENGERYLPDFLLPNIGKGWMIEIKAGLSDTTREVYETLAKVAAHAGRNALLIAGQPHEMIAYYASEFQGPDLNFAYSAALTDGEAPIDGVYVWDHPYLFCRCTMCREVGIAFEGRSHRLCDCWNPSDRGHNFDDPLIVSAADAARSAKFEFGATA